MPTQTDPEEDKPVELHSEVESYRATLRLSTPDGDSTTVIVMRRKQQVWLTLNGAIKTTVLMSDPEADLMIDAITTARSPR